MDLRKMASIQRSFFQSEYAVIQLFKKKNSHLRVICRLGLLITSKKKRIFAVEGSKKLMPERYCTKYFSPSKLKI